MAGPALVTITLPCATGYGNSGCLEEKDLKVLVKSWLNMIHHVSPWPRRPLVSWPVSAIQQPQGSDCLPAPGPCEATAQVLCPVLGPSLPEEQQRRAAKLGRGLENLAYQEWLSDWVEF